MTNPAMKASAGLLLLLAACASAQTEPDYAAAAAKVEAGRAAAKKGDHRSAVARYTVRNTLEMIRETRPDHILILPWNLRDEIVAANPDVASWGGRFVVPIPEVREIG